MAGIERAGLELARFEPADLDGFMAQAIQRGDGAVEFLHGGRRPHGAVWTARWDGLVIGVGGVQILYPGIGAVWALVGPVPRRAWPAVTRRVRRVLDDAGRVVALRRLQASVRVGHDAGCRWAERLGFAREGVMRGYAPDGGDAFLYARVTT